MAFLPKDGVERVCEAIRTVACHGVGVLLVTHNIPQALTITEQITVLRDGHRVLEETTATLTTPRLVTAMVTDTQQQAVTARRPERPREVVLTVRDLCGDGIRGVSLDVRGGEIVGLTGLMGSGFDQFLYLLFGASTARSGSASVHGNPLPLGRLSPRRAIRAGLCLVPGDRARQAAVLDAPAADNITLGNLRRHVRRGLLRQDSIVARATILMDQIGVQPATPRRDLGTFSGGNQQKAVLAKWFDRAPTVLLSRRTGPRCRRGRLERRSSPTSLHWLTPAPPSCGPASTTTTSSRSATPCSSSPTGALPPASMATP